MTLFAATLALALLGTLWVAPKMARIRPLEPDPENLDAPPVAVVIAARDEEQTIEPALRSLLDGLGPATEVVVVDDRSADGTPRSWPTSGPNTGDSDRSVDELPEG